MYLFFILQFMFLVFIVARSMHQEVTKCLQIRKAYNYYCSENTHIVTHTVLKQGWGNQHFIGQAGIAFAVLHMVILKITYQPCMLSQNIGQAMA